MRGYRRKRGERRTEKDEGKRGLTVNGKRKMELLALHTTDRQTRWLSLPCLSTNAFLVIVVVAVFTLLRTFTLISLSLALFLRPSISPLSPFPPIVKGYKSTMHIFSCCCCRSLTHTETRWPSRERSLKRQGSKEERVRERRFTNTRLLFSSLSLSCSLSYQIHAIVSM